MLTIGKIETAGQAETYYTRHYEKDDYYLNKDACGTWHGEGAAKLGVSGEIKEEDWKNIIRGKDITGKQIVELGYKKVEDKNGKFHFEKAHAPGTDLTFSAPKSVSILALVHGKFQDERLLEAHRQAVEDAMKYAEKHFPQMRLKKDGVIREVDTKSFVIARFDHLTSRETEKDLPDPQLHTHNFMMNITERDGKFYALNNTLLYQNKMFLGQVYRSYLAKRTLELGYQIKGEEKGLWEIKGVPKELIEKFSKRRQEVLEKLDKADYDNAKVAAKAAIVTRKTKGHVEMKEVHQSWQEQTKTYIKDLELLKTEQAKKIEQGSPIMKAVAKLSEEEVHWSKKELIQAALAEGIKSGIIVEDVEKDIEVQKQNGKLLQLVKGEREVAAQKELTGKFELPQEVSTFRGINLSARAFRQKTELAKNGDITAAIDIVDKVLTPKRVDKLAKVYGKADNIAWVPMAPFIEGKNAIPSVFAGRLQEHLGGEVIDVLKSTSVRPIPHRFVNHDTRLASAARQGFELHAKNLTLLKDKKVVLVDDQFTTGGTVRDAIESFARRYIKVDAVQTLGAGRNIQLGVEDSLKNTSKQIFGPNETEAIEENLKIPVENLTNSELKTVIKITKKAKSWEGLEYELDKINKNYKEIAGDYRSELGSPGEVSGKDQGRTEEKTSQEEKSEAQLTREESDTKKQLLKYLDRQFGVEPAEQRTKEVRFTTPENIQIEKSIIQNIAERRNSFPVLNSAFIQQQLDQKYNYLRPEQRQAVAKLTTSPDGVNIIQGYAGTGKTTMLKATNELYEQKGYNVTGMSFTGQAADNLQRETGIPSATIHSQLYKLQQEELQPTRESTARQRMKQVWIVDEASMTGNKQMLELTQRAKEANAKLVLVGDGSQLQAINAGKAFRIIYEKDACDKTDMRDILRQKHENLRKAVEQTVFGDIGKAVEKLEDNIVEGKRTFNRHMQITNDYANRSKEERDKTIILTATNKDREQINVYIRESLWEKGEIGRTGFAFNVKNNQDVESKKSFSERDKVVFLNNDRALGVKNGTMGEILDLHRNGDISIQTEKGVKNFNIKNYNWIDHGYVLTNYKAQGQTTKSVLINLDTEKRSLTNRNSFYVSISRATDEVKIYTNNKEGLTNSLRTWQEKTTTYDLKKPEPEQEKSIDMQNIKKEVKNLLSSLEKGKEEPELAETRKEVDRQLQGIEMSQEINMAEKAVPGVEKSQALEKETELEKDMGMG